MGLFYLSLSGANMFYYSTDYMIKYWSMANYAASQIRILNEKSINDFNSCSDDLTKIFILTEIKKH